MKKNKNIAIIIDNLNGGGAEKVASILSIKLSEKKYNVYIFLVDTRNIFYDFQGKIVNIYDKDKPLEHTLYYYKRKYDIDCAISFMENLNFLNIRTKCSEKVIITIHTTLSKRDFYNEKLKKQIELYYPFADKIISVSYGIMQDIKKSMNLNSEIDVLYNFTDKQNILKLSNESLNENIKMFLGNSEYFINIGRFHSVKNQTRLIKQYNYFLKHYKKNVKLLLIGGGEEETKLQKLIENLKIENMVKLIPQIKNPFKYLKKAKAFILSSEYEGLSGVIIESMILGIPVISTDCFSSPRELLGDMKDYYIKLNNIEKLKRGILVSNFKTEDKLITHYMADAMNIICNDDVYRNQVSINSINYMESYTNEKILNKWIDIIEKDEIKAPVVDEIIEAKKLREAENIYIYGAGKIGEILYRKLSKKYNIKAFIVTKNKENKKNYLGLPIFEIDKLLDKDRCPTVVIGVGVCYEIDIIEKMKALGIYNYVFQII